MKRTLYFSELDASKIDPKTATVHDVAVCTVGPARGHGLVVDKTTLAQMYRSATAKGKVCTKLDHKSGIGQVCGFLTDFWVDQDKLRATWTLLKDQPNFAHTWSLIENMHDTCGLSASFTGESDGDRARCKELISVDFVPHAATGDGGLFSRRDIDFDALNENSDQNESDESMNEDQIAELLHELLDHVEHLEAENEQLQAALEALQDEDDDADDEDDTDDDAEPVLSEKGAMAGPQRFGALDIRTFDFESLIEQNRLAGMDAKKAHIEALKTFSRQKYCQINL